MRPVRRLFALSALLTYVAFAPAPVTGVSTTVVISQVYGGGGNAGATFKNDFIELFNRGTVPASLNGWSVQYAASTGTTWQRTNLSNVTLAPGQYYLVQEAAGAGGTKDLPTPDATGSIPMAAGAGKVALVSNQTTIVSGTSCPTGASIVDFVGYGTTTNCFEGAGPTPTLSNTTAALRLGNGAIDTDFNSTDFSAGAPNPRNSSPANPPTISSLTASPLLAYQGEQATFTVVVKPGTNPVDSNFTVTGVFSSIGSPASFTLTGSNPTTGERTYTAAVTVTGEPGPKTVEIKVSDGVGRQASTTLPMGVRTATLSRIHDIQGPGSASPLNDTVVTTEGIVTARKFNGFFIQDLEANYDADPNTSEGVFVFTSSTPPAVAAIGSFVTLVGTVSEFVPSADPYQPPMTEIVNSFGVPATTGVPLPAAVELTTTNLDPNGSVGQLEPLEGMRVSIASAKVVAPTGGSQNEANATSTSSGVFYVVLPGVDRPFREPGIEVFEPIPAGSPATIPRFDANPERVRVDSDALIGAPALDVTPGQTLSNLVGPLDYGFRSYTIDLDPASPATITGVPLAPAAVRTATADEFTVATANLERFFDTTDAAGTSDAVLTPAAFANRLKKVSLQIRDIMGSPDIIGVEEVENLPTLQAIAAKVNDDATAAGEPNPGYVAYLEEGNDIGGIDSGFLVKTSRVDVIDVVQEGKNAEYVEPDGDRALLNDRPPLILRARVHQTADDAGLPVTVIDNHLRSLSSINSATDGNRVRTKRRAQAEYLANLIQARQLADPRERIISVGDYNAFQFNDGYVDSISTIKGTPTAADQVVLASGDLVNPDLVDLVDLAPADQRYSFVFDGNAQELDHIIVTQNMLGLSNGISYGRNNADFPEALRSAPDTPIRISDHDPVVAYFAFPSLSISDVTVTESNNAVVTALFTVALSAPSPNTVTVDFSTADGTATSSDYAPGAGTLVFAPHSTTQTIAVDVFANPMPEPLETFVVNLSAPVNATITDGQGIGTIIDSHDRPLTIRTFAPQRRRAGMAVEIIGTGFTNATSVAFNGTPASFTILSSTVIRAIVPATATSGSITVVTPTGTATSAASFVVTP